MLSWIADKIVNFIIKKILMGPYKLGQMFKMGIECQKMPFPNLKRQTQIKVIVPILVWTLISVLTLLIAPISWALIFISSITALFIAGYLNVEVSDEVKGIQKMAQNIPNPQPVRLAPIVLLIAGIVVTGVGIWKVLPVQETQAGQSPSQPTPAPRRQPTKAVVVDAKSLWVNTGLSFSRGYSLEVSASGQVNASDDASDASFKWVGPDGWGNDPAQNWTVGDTGMKSRAVNILGKGSSLMCLVGRIGNGKPFLIGRHYSTVVQEEGMLLLASNDAIIDNLGRQAGDLSWRNNQGSFSVDIFVERKWEGDLNPKLLWFDTGFKVRAGEAITVKATGVVVWDETVGENGSVGPNGAVWKPSGFEAKDRPQDFFCQNFGCGALIMKIGGVVYCVGASDRVTVKLDGTVKFMVNDRPTGLSDNMGSFHITVR